MIKIPARLRLPLMLAPALVVIILLFGGGLLLALTQSFGFLPVIGLNEFSLAAYKQLFQDDVFLTSLGLTLWIGIASTGISTILALACALLLRRPFWGVSWVRFLFQLNIPIPHLVGAIGILLLFSQSGLFARLAYLAGLIRETSDFPALVYDSYAIGIILEYVWKTTCFTGVILLANLQTLGDNFEDVARTLGANSWQRLRYVTLPLLRPAVMSSSILVFAFTFGAFEVPFLLGQRFPSALPVLAYRKYVDSDLTSRPEAMAISIVIAILITFLVLVYMRLSKQAVKRV